LPPVTGIQGASSEGLLASEACIPFERVDYTDGLAEIDFFRSIGRLPAPVLNAMLVSRPGGTRERCARTLSRTSRRGATDIGSRFIEISCEKHRIGNTKKSTG